MKRIVIILISILALAGCRTSKEIQIVEVPIVQRDTLRIIENKNDSVYVHDSTFVKVAGDTVYQYVYRDRWRERITHDTIYNHQVDTITKVKIATEIVKERYTPGFVKLLAYIGIGAIIFFVFILILKFR